MTNHNNTYLGLYRYTRLPFGVVASPAIFQQTMDFIMSGLNGVGGILDVLIVTGSFVVDRDGIYPSP